MKKLRRLFSSKYKLDPVEGISDKNQHFQAMMQEGIPFSDDNINNDEISLGINNYKYCPTGGCIFKGTTEEIKEHRKECPLRLIVCEFCGNNLILCHWPAHKQDHMDFLNSTVIPSTERNEEKIQSQITEA